MDEPTVADAERDPAPPMTPARPSEPRPRHHGPWLIGLGVAAVGLGILATQIQGVGPEAELPPPDVPASMPPTRDDRRVQAAVAVMHGDPAAAAVLLREVEAPADEPGWAEAALQVLQVLQPRCATMPCDADEPATQVRLPMPGPVRALASSRRGLAVVGTRQGLARVDAEGAEPITTEEVDTLGYQAVAITPDGRWAAASDPQGNLRLWSTAGAQTWVAASGLEQVWAIALSPAGDRLAVGDATGELVIWAREASLLVIRARLRVDGGMVRALAWLADGTLLIGDPQGRLRRWSATVPELEASDSGLGAIAEIVVSPAPNRFATLHTNGKVGLWSRDPTGRPTREHRLQCNDDLLVAIAFTDDGRLLGVSRHGGVFDWQGEHRAFCRSRAGLGVDQAVVRAVLTDDGHTAITAELDDLAVRRWSVDAYPSDPQRLRERLWGATHDCLSLERRMELLGDDEPSARADLERCQQARPDTPTLRP